MYVSILHEVSEVNIVKSVFRVLESFVDGVTPACIREMESDGEIVSCSSPSHRDILLSG